MSKNSSPLFQPIKLRSLDIPNRIVVEPMCQYSAIDGSANEWHRIHLGSMCLSGAGIVMVEATACEARGRITPNCLGLYSDENERCLAEILRTVREVSNVALGIQIGHAGRKASIARPWEGRGPVAHEKGGWATIGPSPIPFAPDWPAPQEMSDADLETVKQAHIQATERAKRLGFDLIELHSAHGYLLSTFLSPLSNHRTDKYGGDLEARMRYPLEVIKAVRDTWPEEKPMSVKFNGTDWADGGFDGDDSVVYALALKEIGVDLVFLSGGGVSSSAKVPVGPSYQLPYAERVKKDANILAGAVGMIYSPHQAETIIRDQQADFVGMARAFLFDPRWVQHAAVTLGEEVAYPPQYERGSPSLWKPAQGFQTWNDITD